MKTHNENNGFSDIRFYPKDFAGNQHVEAKPKIAKKLAASPMVTARRAAVGKNSFGISCNCGLPNEERTMEAIIKFHPLFIHHHLRIVRLHPDKAFAAPGCGENVAQNRCTKVAPKAVT